MKPEEQLKAFEAHVKKINKSFSRKASSLKGVFDLLEEQIKGKKIKALDGAAIADQVRKSKGDGDEKYDKYRPALDALVAVWGSTKDYGAAGGKPTEKDDDDDADLPEILKWVNDRKKGLEGLGAFFVADHVTFAHVRKVAEEAMLKRKVGINEVEVGKAQNAATIAQSTAERSKTTVQMSSLKVVHDATLKAKSAVCTTFAFSAAYVLAKDEGGPRVEVISHSAGHAGTHCFVIVGRPKDSDLATAATWINESVVVDVWALALGWPMIYSPAKKFAMSPIEKEANKLKSVFDSDKL